MLLVAIDNSTTKALSGSVLAINTMDELKIRGRAKINLSLDVVGKREDGYHKLKMIIQQIDLYDEIFVQKREKGIFLETDCKFLPTNERNIAYRAAKLIMDKYQLDGGVYIYIKKNIPVAAGLAGGSTNAAAVLQGINKLWRLQIPKEELMQIGLKLGADVPFCILGGAALAQGIGEQLTPIKGWKHWVLLCKPNISVSTAEVYRNLQWEKINDHPKTDEILKSLETDDIHRVAENLCNVLETVTIPMHPLIKEIKIKMIECHALGSLMSGSGPTVFGLYKDYEKAKKACQKLSRVYKQTYLVKTYNINEI
jgi:4-diphosphocytidyl-2-C-methyl-D-erythritol kinase